MGLIKKPAAATLEQPVEKVKDSTPSLPSSTVGKAPPVEETAKDKKSKISRKTDGLNLRQKLIMLQNVTAAIQRSQEWANIAIQLKTELEREAKFEQLVRSNYALLLKIADE